MVAGVVYWSPPDSAVAAAQQACSTPLSHSYGPALGTPGLRASLLSKVKAENGLEGVRPGAAAAPVLGDEPVNRFACCGALWQTGLSPTPSHVVWGHAEQALHPSA